MAEQSHPFPYFGLAVTSDIAAIQEKIDEKYVHTKRFENHPMLLRKWQEFHDNAGLIAEMKELSGGYEVDRDKVNDIVRVCLALIDPVLNSAVRDNTVYPEQIDFVQKTAVDSFQIDPDEAERYIKKLIADSGVMIHGSSPRKASVFISANSRDYESAREVYDLLTEQGVEAFFSPESLPDLGVSDYRKAIDNALDASEHMVVVTSSVERVTSRWVEAEWGWFINEKRSGRKDGNLITVLVGDADIGDLPPSLRYFEVVPFEKSHLERLIRYVR